MYSYNNNNNNSIPSTEQKTSTVRSSPQFNSFAQLPSTTPRLTHNSKNSNNNNTTSNNNNNSNAKKPNPYPHSYLNKLIHEALNEINALPIIDGVNFDWSKNIIILGEAGAGKSNLLEALINSRNIEQANNVVVMPNIHTHELFSRTQVTVYASLAEAEINFVRSNHSLESVLSWFYTVLCLNKYNNHNQDSHNNQTLNDFTIHSPAYYTGVVQTVFHQVYPFRNITFYIPKYKIQNHVTNNHDMLEPMDNNNIDVNYLLQLQHRLAQYFTLQIHNDLIFTIVFAQKNGRNDIRVEMKGGSQLYFTELGNVNNSPYPDLVHCICSLGKGIMIQSISINVPKLVEQGFRFKLPYIDDPVSYPLSDYLTYIINIARNGNGSISNNKQVQYATKSTYNINELFNVQYNDPGLASTDFNAEHKHSNARMLSQGETNCLYSLLLISVYCVQIELSYNQKYYRNSHNNYNNNGDDIQLLNHAKLKLIVHNPTSLAVEDWRNKIFWHSLVKSKLGDKMSFIIVTNEFSLAGYEVFRSFYKLILVRSTMNQSNFNNNVGTKCIFCLKKHPSHLCYFNEQCTVCSKKGHIPKACVFQNERNSYSQNRTIFNSINRASNRESTINNANQPIALTNIDPINQGKTSDIQSVSVIDGNQDCIELISLTGQSHATSARNNDTNNNLNNSNNINNVNVNIAQAGNLLNSIDINSVINAALQVNRSNSASNSSAFFASLLGNNTGGINLASLQALTNNAANNAANNATANNNNTTGINNPSSSPSAGYNALTNSVTANTNNNTSTTTIKNPSDIPIFSPPTNHNSITGFSPSGSALFTTQRLNNTGTADESPINKYKGLLQSRSLSIQAPTLPANADIGLATLNTSNALSALNQANNANNASPDVTNNNNINNPSINNNPDSAIKEQNNVSGTITTATTLHKAYDREYLFVALQNNTTQYLSDVSLQQDIADIFLKQTPVVYVEGIGDISLYRIIFGPNIEIRELGGCNQVIQFMSSLSPLRKKLSSSENIFQPCVGIVDLDQKQNSEIEDLARIGVFTLNVSAVENIFLSLPIIELYFHQIAKAESRISSNSISFGKIFQSLLIELLQLEKDIHKSDAARFNKKSLVHDINGIISNISITAQCGDTELISTIYSILERNRPFISLGEVSSIANSIQQAKAANLFAPPIDGSNTALANSWAQVLYSPEVLQIYYALLTKIRGKAIASAFGKLLPIGIGWDQYCNSIYSYLMEDNEAAQTFIRQFRENHFFASDNHNYSIFETWQNFTRQFKFGHHTSDNGGVNNNLKEKIQSQTDIFNEDCEDDTIEPVLDDADNDNESNDMIMSAADRSLQKLRDASNSEPAVFSKAYPHIANNIIMQPSKSDNIVSFNEARINYKGLINMGKKFYDSFCNIYSQRNATETYQSLAQDAFSLKFQYSMQPHYDDSKDDNKSNDLAKDYSSLLFNPCNNSSLKFDNKRFQDHRIYTKINKANWQLPAIFVTIYLDLHCSLQHRDYLYFVIERLDKQSRKWIQNSQNVTRYYYDPNELEIKRSIIQLKFLILLIEQIHLKYDYIHDNINSKIDNHNNNNHIRGMNRSTHFMYSHRLFHYVTSLINNILTYVTKSYAQKQLETNSIVGNNRYNLLYEGVQGVIDGISVLERSRVVNADNAHDFWKSIQSLLHQQHLFNNRNTMLANKINPILVRIFHSLKWILPDLCTVPSYGMPTLSQLLRVDMQFGRRTRLILFLQLCDYMHRLHRCKIVHNFVYLDHILVDRTRLQLFVPPFKLTSEQSNYENMNHQSRYYGHWQYLNNTNTNPNATNNNHNSHEPKKAKLARKLEETIAQLESATDAQEFELCMRLNYDIQMLQKEIRKLEEICKFSIEFPHTSQNQYKKWLDKQLINCQIDKQYSKCSLISAEIIKLEELKREFDALTSNNANDNNDSNNINEHDLKKKNKRLKQIVAEIQGQRLTKQLHQQQNKSQQIQQPATDLLDIETAIITASLRSDNSDNIIMTAHNNDSNDANGSNNSNNLKNPASEPDILPLYPGSSMQIQVECYTIPYCINNMQFDFTSFSGLDTQTKRRVVGIALNSFQTYLRPQDIVTDLAFQTPPYVDTKPEGISSLLVPLFIAIYLGKRYRFNENDSVYVHFNNCYELNVIVHVLTELFSVNSNRIYTILSASVQPHEIILATENCLSLKRGLRPRVSKVIFYQYKYKKHDYSNITAQMMQTDKATKIFYLDYDKNSRNDVDRNRITINLYDLFINNYDLPNDVHEARNETIKQVGKILPKCNTLFPPPRHFSNIKNIYRLRELNTQLNKMSTKELVFMPASVSLPAENFYVKVRTDQEEDLEQHYLGYNIISQIVPPNRAKSVHLFNEEYITDYEPLRYDSRRNLDIFQLGLILYYLMNNDAIPKSPTMEQIEQHLSTTQSDAVNERINEVIRSMLEPPNSRIRLYKVINKVKQILNFGNNNPKKQEFCLQFCKRQVHQAIQQVKSSGFVYPTKKPEEKETKQLPQNNIKPTTSNNRTLTEDKLSAKLKKAIKAQDYELCIKLRDQILAMKPNASNQSDKIKQATVPETKADAKPSRWDQVLLDYLNIVLRYLGQKPINWDISKDNHLKKLNSQVILAIRQADDNNNNNIDSWVTQRDEETRMNISQFILQCNRNDIPIQQLQLLSRFCCHNDDDNKLNNNNNTSAVHNYLDINNLYEDTDYDEYAIVAGKPMISYSAIAHGLKQSGYHIKDTDITWDHVKTTLLNHFKNSVTTEPAREFYIQLMFSRDQTLINKLVKQFQDKYDKKQQQAQVEKEQQAKANPNKQQKKKQKQQKFDFKQKKQQANQISLPESVETQRWRYLVDLCYKDKTKHISYLLLSQFPDAFPGYNLIIYSPEISAKPIIIASQSTEVSAKNVYIRGYPRSFRFAPLIPNSAMESVTGKTRFDEYLLNNIRGVCGMYSIVRLLQIPRPQLQSTSIHKLLLEDSTIKNTILLQFLQRLHLVIYDNAYDKLQPVRERCIIEFIHLLRSADKAQSNEAIHIYYGLEWLLQFLFTFDSLVKNDEYCDWVSFCNLLLSTFIKILAQQDLVDSDIQKCRNKFSATSKQKLESKNNNNNTNSNEDNPEDVTDTKTGIELEADGFNDNDNGHNYDAGLFVVDRKEAILIDDLTNKSVLWRYLGLKIDYFFDRAIYDMEYKYSCRTVNAVVKYFYDTFTIIDELPDNNNVQLLTEIQDYLLSKAIQLKLRYHELIASNLSLQRLDMQLYDIFGGSSKRYHLWFEDINPQAQAAANAFKNI